MNDDKQKKVTIDYAKSRGVEFLQPDINLSDLEFKLDKTNDKKNIRYGFSKIKGLGESVQYIIEVRKFVGSFKDFDDFMYWMKEPTLKAYINKHILKKDNNRTVVTIGIYKKLILSGAFDSMFENRYELINYYIDNYESKKNQSEHKPYDISTYNNAIKYSLELAYLGNYVSGHPLDKLPSSNLINIQDGEQLTLPVIIHSKKVKKIKNGWKKGEDYLEIEFQAPNGLFYKGNLFPEIYNLYKEKIKSCNLPKSMEGKAEELFDRILKENSKRAKATCMIQGTYSSNFNNFTVNKMKFFG